MGGKATMWCSWSNMVFLSTERNLSIVIGVLPVCWQLLARLAVPRGRPTSGHVRYTKGNIALIIYLVPLFYLHSQAF